MQRRTVRDVRWMLDLAQPAVVGDNHPLTRRHNRTTNGLVAFAVSLWAFNLAMVLVSLH